MQLPSCGSAEDFLELIIVNVKWKVSNAKSEKKKDKKNCHDIIICMQPVLSVGEREWGGLD